MSLHLARDRNRPDGSATLVQFTDGVGTWGCAVPVLPGGDEADTAPLEARTAKCGHPTRTLIGAVPTCVHHIRVVLQMLMLHDRDIPELTRAIRCEEE